MPSIKKVVDFETILYPIKYLYNLAKDNKLKALPAIQRNDQKKEWLKSSGEKVNSYLNFLFSGASSIMPFTIIPKTVFLNELNRKIETVECYLETVFGDDKIQYKTELSILKKLLSEITVRFQNTQFILLDGQNRLEYAIVPFFDGTHDFKYDKSLVNLIDDNGNERNLTFFNYKKLDKNEQDVFDNLEVVVNVGKEGDVDLFLKTLIAINDGIPWTPFERLAVEWTPILEKMNDIIIYDKHSKINDLFKNTAKMTGGYAIPKKGDGKIMLELLFWMVNKEFPSMSKLEKFVKFNPDSENIKAKYFKVLIGYLEWISDAVGAPEIEENIKLNPAESYSIGLDSTFCKEGGIRSLIMLLAILENKINRNDLYKEVRKVFPKKDQQFDIRDIKQSRNFVKEFINWHAHKTDSTAQLKLPDGDYQDKKPKEGTYADSLESIYKNVYDRESGIIEYIKEKMPKLVEENIVNFSYGRKHMQYPSKTAVIASQDEKDFYNKGTPLDILSKKHLDHVVPLSKGGSNERSNLVYTTPKVNLQKSNKY